jgi:anaerobic magnesium-protoporphyrin IX monomethyl ester cyclase
LPNPDILLIQPPVRDFYLTAKRTIPYGLACIASCLIDNGFSVEILDGLASSKSRILDLPEEMTYLKKYYGKPDLSPFALFHHFRHFGYSFEHMGNIARQSNAFLVGISSLFTAYSNEALKTAEIVKKFHPKCKVVLGGHHPTAMPLKVMESKNVDFVIRGEGEVSMLMLAKALKEGRGLESIPGIVFRKKDGTLHMDEPAIMDQPDHYPLPAMHLVKHSFYQRGKMGSTMTVSSRGCPMKCTYCCVGASWQGYRRRSVESVLNEIESSVTRYNVRFIDFEDENLSLDKKWFMRFLDEIKRRFGESGIELRAMNGLFPPSLDEEMIWAMKEAGFKSLNLSLGSTSKIQLAKFRRPDVRKALEKVLLLAERYSLEAVCYVIAGGPGQNAEDSLADLLYLAQRRALAGVSIFYPAPGSADFKLCESSGILPGHVSLMRSSALPLSHTTSRVESVTILRLGRILNFMKSLLDGGENIPEPLPFSKTLIANPSHRRENGKKLLQWFLFDGRIRGLTPDGEVFEHNISTRLTKKFIDELRSVEVKGHVGSCS